MIVAATSNPGNVSRFDHKQTEYQIHDTQSSIKVIDFTMKKLIKFADEVGPADRLGTYALLDEYRKCHVAIAWRSGKPVWLKIKSERSG